jgi:hypothetical protein
LSTSHSNASSTPITGHSFFLYFVGNWYLSFFLDLPPTFFAHYRSASREWVIPAKPKPGRKPKRDLASTTVQANDVLTYFLIRFGLL